MHAAPDDVEELAVADNRGGKHARTGELLAPELRLEQRIASMDVDDDASKDYSDSRG